MNYIMGIDPGKSGGVAIMDMEGTYVRAFKFGDKTLTDLFMLFEELELCYQISFCYIENVHAMPKQGVTSCFNFGKQYGGLLMLLTCQQIPYEKVTPVKWMRALSCLSGGDKNVTKSKAQELFPDLKVTHAIADSLLIAEYGRRQRLSTDNS